MKVLKSVLIAAALAACPLAAQVQHIGKDAGTVTTTTVSLPAANLAGDSIVAMIRGGGSTSEAFAVADASGNVYQKGAQGTQTADNDSLAIYYALNIKAGVNTITVSQSISATLRVEILEYPPATLDIAALPLQGSGTAISVGPITTTAAGDLIVGMGITANEATFTAAAPWKIADTVGSKLVAASYVQAAAGAASFNCSLAAADQWAALEIAFKPVAPPGVTVTGLAPASGSSVGGTAVVITGTGFAAGATVIIGGKAAANVVDLSGTSITVSTPAGAIGPATVVVTVGGLSGSLASGFTYVQTYSISGAVTGLSGTAFVLQGATTTATMASDVEVYSFSGLVNGTYTLTPALLNYTFTPASQTVTISGSSVVVNFVANPGIAQAPHQVILAWAAPSIAVGPSCLLGTDPNCYPTGCIPGAAGCYPAPPPLAYNVLRSFVSGGPYSQLNSALITGLTYTDTSVSAGQVLYYVGQSVDSSGDVSSYSNEAVVTVP